MTEVIATRVKHVVIGGVVLIVFGVALIAVAAIEFSGIAGAEGDIFGILFLVMAAVFFGCAAFSIVSYLRVSPIIAAREGDRLLLPDGECKITEPTNATARRAHSRYGYRSWGTLILEINEVKHKYNYVANVEDAQARLVALMTEYHREGNNG